MKYVAANTSFEKDAHSATLHSHLLSNPFISIIIILLLNPDKT